MEFKDLFIPLKKCLGDGNTRQYFFRDLMAMITTVSEEEWGTELDPNTKRTNDNTILNFIKRGLSQSFAQSIVNRLTPEILEENINDKPHATREALAKELTPYNEKINAENVGKLVSEMMTKIITRSAGLLSDEEIEIKKEKNRTASQKRQIQNHCNSQESITAENEIVFQQAQAFCIEYEEYIEFLPLCQIASSVNQFHKYVRQMYTDYCKCSIAVRTKILEINDCRILDFSDKAWIDKSVSLFDKVIHERKLCTVNYLYDGAKYFHRAFERYAGYHVEFDPWIFNPLIKFENPIFGTELKCNLYRCIADYLELLKDNPEYDDVPPLDAIWAYCRDGNTPEPDVTYWVCMSIIASCSQLVDQSIDDNDLYYVDLGDSEHLINTQEDMYLYALLELYKLYYRSNGKS